MLKRKTGRINHRLEKDFLGLKAIPKTALYGINTARAAENFPISIVKTAHYPDFICAIAILKRVAAEANAEMGLISMEKSNAIIYACNELICGNYHENFILSMLQGGAGASTNMNANEVIANIALLHMGKECGEYESMSPLGDINLSQSINDVYISSVRLGLSLAIPRLVGEMNYLAEFFAENESSKNLWPEMQACSAILKGGVAKLSSVSRLLKVIYLGVNPVGVENEAWADKQEKILRDVSVINDMGTEVVISKTPISSSQNYEEFIKLSKVLKKTAVAVSKSSNEISHLLFDSFAPSGGVNPFISDAVNQVACEVIGNDATVSFALEAGREQLGAFESVIAISLFKSIYHLQGAIKTLRLGYQAAIKPVKAPLVDIRRAPLVVGSHLSVC